MDGLSSSFTPTAEASGENAEFGEESLMELEVTHADWEPLPAVAHPTGKAGAPTPSKSSAGFITNTSWNKTQREKDSNNNEDSPHFDPFSSGMADDGCATATSCDSGAGRTRWCTA